MDLSEVENRVLKMLTDTSLENMPLELYTERMFLIKHHEDYMRNLSLTQNKPTVSTIYPASQSQCGSNTQIPFVPENRVRITDLMESINTAMEGKYFLCRSIVPPFRMTGLVTVVDDPEGENSVRLTLYNYGQIETSPEFVLPVGTILAIKNPFFKQNVDSGYCVRCDNPANVVVIDDSQFFKLFPNLKWRSEIPEKYKSKKRITPVLNLTTADEWKTLGNNYFRRKIHTEAIKAYTRGLALSSEDSDLLSNRSASYIHLEEFEDALKDAEAVLQIDPRHEKGVIRKVRSLCGLKKYVEAVEFMDERSVELDENDIMRSYLESLSQRIKQQLNGEYDMLYYLRDKSVRFIESAEFVGSVAVVDIPNKGRGVVTTEDIMPGQLLMACKPFAIVFPGDNLESRLGIHDLNIDAESGRVYSRNHKKLVAAIAQKLIMKPELGEIVYSLFAGPELSYLDAKKGDDCTVLDIERINGVCAYNVFKGEDIEHRSSDPLSQKDSLGLWILPSFINHCCFGNCFWELCGELLFVRACKDIPKGEELSISYVRTVNTYEKRMQVFHSFGIKCDCKLCELERSETPEVHSQRKQILDGIRNIPKNTILTSTQVTALQNAVAELEKLRPEAPLLNYYLIVPKTILSRSCFSARDYIKSAEILEEVYQLCDYSLIDFAVSTAMNIVAAYLKVQRVKKAKKWSHTLKQVLLVAYGSTTPIEMIGNNTFMEMQVHGINI